MWFCDWDALTKGTEKKKLIYRKCLKQHSPSLKPFEFHGRMWLHCHRHGGGIFPVTVSPVSFLPSSPFGWYYLYHTGRPEKLGTEWHIVVGVEIGHLHICIFLLFPKQKGSLFIAYLTRGLGPFIQSVVQLSKNVQSRGAGQAAPLPCSEILGVPATIQFYWRD